MGDRSGAVRALVVAVLGLVAGSAWAQPASAPAEDSTELSLEQLIDLDVHSASKFTQKASAAPSAVSVVTAADIRRHGWRTLAEILASLRGLYTYDDRNYTYLGALGFAPLGDFSSRVLVLVDGLRINEPIYGSGAVGREFPVDVGLIDRVEFVPGPGSALYGSNAVLGVVNVVTRDGRAIGGAEAELGVGSGRERSGRASVGRRFAGGLDLVVSASGYDARNGDQRYPEFAQPGVSDGIARGRDGERAQSAFVKLGWGGFTLQATHVERLKHLPTASYESRFDDPRTRTRDMGSSAELRYAGTLGDDGEIAARVSRSAYDYLGVFPYDDPSAAPQPIVNLDTSRSRWWGGELRLGRRFDGHRLVGGIEFQRNSLTAQRNVDEDPFALYVDERHASSWTAVYLQDEIALAPQLVLNAGLRQDRYEGFGAIVNPRLALIWNATPALVVKALAGRAFRAPNDYERFWSSAPQGVKANPRLDPERISTWELAAEWRLASLARVTASAFGLRIEDLIVLGTDPADGLDVFRNQGSARVRGAQFELERLWTGGAALRANLSLFDGEGADGQRLANSPRVLAKLGATRPLVGDALRAAIDLRFTGDRLTRSGARVGGFAVADLTLTSERIVPGLRLTASVRNLFDRRWADPASNAHVQDAIVQDGRALRLQASLRF